MLVLWPFFIVYIFLFSSNYKIKLKTENLNDLCMYSIYTSGF